MDSFEQNSKMDEMKKTTETSKYSTICEKSLEKKSRKEYCISGTDIFCKKLLSAYAQ